MPWIRARTLRTSAPVRVVLLHTAVCMTVAHAHAHGACTHARIHTNTPERTGVAGATFVGDWKRFAESVGFLHGVLTSAAFSQELGMCGELPQEVEGVGVRHESAEHTRCVRCLRWCPNILVFGYKEKQERAAKTWRRRASARPSQHSARALPHLGISSCAGSSGSRKRAIHPQGRHSVYRDQASKPFGFEVMRYI